MRQITHVELLHRPGERALAARFFELLGCETIDRNGHWFTTFVDPAAERDYATNVFYASEVGAEQWAFEQSLAALVAGLPLTLFGAAIDKNAYVVQHGRTRPVSQCRAGLGEQHGSAQ